MTHSIQSITLASISDITDKLVQSVQRFYPDLGEKFSIGFSFVAILLAFWGIVVAQEAQPLLLLVGCTTTIASYAITAQLGLNLSTILSDLLMCTIGFLLLFIVVSAVCQNYGIPNKAILVFNLIAFGATAMVNLHRIAELTCSQELAQMFGFSLNHCLH